MPTLVKGFVVGSALMNFDAEGNEVRRPTILEYEVVQDEIAILARDSRVLLDREAAAAVKLALDSFLGVS